MSLSVGIIGLTNVGKSTLFNALVARRLSPTAAHPFTTIEPHEAVVPVPDERLGKLAELVAKSTSGESKPTPEVSKLNSRHPPLVVSATVTFIDIAGLVKGAHEGAGLGNQFLSKIREVDALVHVVRTFDPSASSGQVIPHVMGNIDPVRDIEVVNLELELGGITGKPVIYVANIDEKHLEGADTIPPSRWEEMVGDAPVIEICAKLEEELSDLEPEERREYLKQLGVEQSGIEQLIQAVYKLLGLITFYTIKGGKEIHAWSLKKGSTALSAAQRVHTDFARNFIKSEVINVNELLGVGGWQKAKEQGKIRFGGREYIVGDEDVIEFKVGD